MNERIITWQMRVLTLVIFLTGVFIGKSDPLIETGDRAGIIAGFAIGFEVVWWCALQARQHGRPLTEGGMLMMYLTWPVGVPVYLLYTEKLKGLGIIILGALLFLVGAMTGLFLNPYGPQAW